MQDNNYNAIMGHRKVIFVLTFLTVSLLSVNLFPCVVKAEDQSPRVNIKHSNFTVESALTTKDGLPANGVNALCQDEEGYIWAATYNGLVRYDGNEYKIYNSSNVKGLQSNRFLSVIEGDNGAIWAGMEENTILKITDDTTVTYHVSEIDKQVHVTVLEKGQNDNLWIGTSAGLFVLKNDSIHTYQQFYGNRVQQIVYDSNSTYVLFQSQLYRIGQDGKVDQKVLEMTDDGIIHTSNQRITYLEGVNTVFSDILIKEGEIWLLTHEALLSIRNRGYELLVTDKDIKSRTLFGIEKRERVGGYFLYGYEGLSSISGLGTDHLKAVRYTHYTVKDILVDHEGSIWASTRANGLRQYIWTPVFQGESKDVFNDIPLTSLLKEKNGPLWVGTNCDGIYRLQNGQAKKIGGESERANICVWSLMKSDDDTLWIGTWGEGLQYRAPGSDIYRKFDKEELENVNVIFSIYQTQSGDIWIGSYRNGLFRYDGRKVTPVKTVNGQKVPPVRSMYQDEKGKLWLATDSGIGYVRNDKVILPEKFDQLNTKSFRTIETDNRGRYWFGSYGGGLLVYKPGGEIKTITAENGLFDETVSQLEFDKDGDLWLAGNKGVTFIDNQEIKAFFDGVINEMKVGRIGTRKGLQVRETSGGFQPSHQMDSKGRLYIPMVQGLTVIYTDKMKLNKTPPNVVIDDIRVDGNSYDIDSFDEVPYDSRRYVFDFSAMSYVNPEMVRFKYKLKGFEEQWNKTGENKNAVYTSLAPGDYTLQVKASNNDGYWSKKAQKLSFTVRPPFWQTIWFYLLAGLILGAIGVGAYQWRVYRIKRYNRQLEQQVQERTRKLEEANEALKEHINEKNKLFSILAHDLRNPFASLVGYLQLILEQFEEKENEEDAEMTREILQSVRNTHELLENLLQWANSRRGELGMQHEEVDLASIVRQAIDSVSSQIRFKDIKVENKVDTDEYFAKCDRNMIMTVIRNLVSNAIKFSEIGSTVTVTADRDDGVVIISVADAGEGMEVDELDKILSSDKENQKSGTEGEKGIGMGLMLCQEFVTKHGGEIWVESEPEEGSTFSFSLPVEGA